MAGRAAAGLAGRTCSGTHCRYQCVYDTGNALFQYLHEGDTTHSKYIGAQQVMGVPNQGRGSGLLDGEP
jgi:hypothetical protein